MRTDEQRSEVRQHLNKPCTAQRWMRGGKITRNLCKKKSDQPIQTYLSKVRNGMVEESADRTSALIHHDTGVA